MNIKKFRIENFRSLKKLNISDFGNTTIFYGDNNAGKSNVLSALHLIFSRKPKLVSGEGLSGLENFYEGVIVDSQNTFFNNDTKAPITFSIDIEVLKSELTIDTEIKSIFSTGSAFTFTFEGQMTFLGQGDADYSDFKIESIKKGTAIIYSNKKDVSFFPGLDKGQKKQPQLSKAFTHLIDIFNDCVYVVSSDRDMHETPMEVDVAKHLSPKTFKKFLHSLYLSPKNFNLFEQINLVYSQSPFNFGTISFSKDRGNLEIMIKENDFRLPIKHLGSGASQALYIISSIVCSKSRIVAIEELEQNLSPRKQFEILRKIQAMIDDSRLSLNQLIISSHSSVYAKPKLGTIYFIEKVDGKTNINTKETKKIGKKMQSHLATSQAVWDEAAFEEIKRILKEEHDFE
jgi:AAA15 family ATPase/GTPase